mgnify:CR=1 FL=1
MHDCWLKKNSVTSLKLLCCQKQKLYQKDEGTVIAPVQVFALIFWGKDEMLNYLERLKL